MKGYICATFFAVLCSVAYVHGQEPSPPPKAEVETITPYQQAPTLPPLPHRPNYGNDDEDCEYVDCRNIYERLYAWLTGKRCREIPTPGPSDTPESSSETPATEQSSSSVTPATEPASEPPLASAGAPAEDRHRSDKLAKERQGHHLKQHVRNHAHHEKSHKERKAADHHQSHHERKHENSQEHHKN